MFAALDNKLIGFFQWVVRQCELYTSIQRKTIINLDIKLLEVSIMLSIVSLLIGTALEKNLIDTLLTLFITGCNTCMFFALHQFTLVMNKRNRSKNSLPQEIISRINHRLVLLVGILILFLMAFYLDVYSPITDTSHLYFRFFSHSLCFIFFVYLIFEYLLCTTSLPPGEMQKKQEEREMRYMTPQRIKN